MRVYFWGGGYRQKKTRNYCFISGGGCWLFAARKTVHVKQRLFFFFYRFRNLQSDKCCDTNEAAAFVCSYFAKIVSL